MKYLLLICFFVLFSASCENLKKEKTAKTPITKQKTHVQGLNKENPSKCKVQIQNQDLVLICNGKETIYKYLIINEMSLSTELIQNDDGFSLLYESNASATKSKEKFDFIYSLNGLILISKEIVKFGKDGLILNKLFVDNYDMSQKTYDDLQAIGNSLKEEFNKKPIGFVYNSKNILFAKMTYKSYPEDLYVDYPKLGNVDFKIINVESANNQAFSLEKIQDNNFSKSLLKEIISQYPDRTVAFLNLADVDWALANKEDAKKNYNLYLFLMKKQKKDLSKVPQRVYDRIK
ncbi:hypothetical protein [Chryseobacterium sp. JAH]|uniref:hypothetical protein n=1 Tax=Chryseobacterium sp. JAH TaxID=1742858 RepID=UPI0007410ABA|nr:hypothetical protein [Chryseobacterium sp. JAH]KUJ50298.1 hypothetical protein AR685_15245 [Chryseobacterium sp. JAH]